MHYTMKTKWLVSDIPEDITSKSYRSPEELRQLAQILLHKKKNGTRESTWAQAAYNGTDFEIKVPPPQK